MQTASKKIINGWAMYDWANSVYNLVITTTFFPAYYAAVTAPTTEKFRHGVQFLGRTFVNTELKDYFFSAAYVVIIILSPILSSIADYRGNKKAFMRTFCYLGAVCCSLMFFFDGDNVIFALFMLMLACVGFYGSQVFYNSYLPEIASEADQNRISARGYTFGYIGSVLMQMIGFGMVMAMPDSSLPLKLSFLLVGLWWAGFAQITFARLPPGNRSGKERGNVLSNGFVELKKVWNQLRHMPVLKRFLAAFLFYSMGVQTVMLVATDFGIKELKLENATLILVLVVIQLVAIIGAILMSRLSNRFGNINILAITVLLWMVVCIAGYYMQTELQFYILASLVGLVMGGIQSVSRSTYSKYMPPTKDTASFFSFYDITEKLAIVVGVFSFGFIEGLTHSMRNSILALIVFFVLGFISLLLTGQSLKHQKKA
ncbi:MAG TPA: MFS transporter [Flavisolibacter sp.]|nr:MFS transporter [Flavisolibacter sp.]